MSDFEYLHCNNCDYTGTVNRFSDTCPKCKKPGCLTYVVCPICGVETEGELVCPNGHTINDNVLH